MKVESRHGVGMLTDRDVCTAANQRGCAPRGVALGREALEVDRSATRGKE